MTDYISREYVLKCMEDSRKNAGISEESASKVRKWLYKAPAADVREVVYCKDCRHRDPEDHKCDSGEAERQGCPLKVADDYFCAYGER